MLLYVTPRAVDCLLLTNEQARGGAITTGITPNWVTRIDSVAGIRQVTTRLRQKVEEKVQAEGQLSGELKEVVDRAHDLLVDMTDAVEQGNLSERKKREWAGRAERPGQGRLLHATVEVVLR